MSKYVSRIMQEIYDFFDNNFDDDEEKIWFLAELIEELKHELDYIVNNE